MQRWLATGYELDEAQEGKKQKNDYLLHIYTSHQL